LHRVSVLGGREGMPRSLGSVLGGAVTRFLGVGERSATMRVIPMPDVRSWSNGVAVSRDGATLLVSGWGSCPDAIHEFAVADGSLRRTIGCEGDGPLQLRVPCQVCIAPDGFAFVADSENNRVQVLTPRLDFHGFVGVGDLAGPCGVCTNADVVVVAESDGGCISVFSRGDGALLRCFGREGSDDGELCSPLGICFMSDDRRVAVADYDNHRVSVFSVEGEFIRHVGVGVLRFPVGVACSAFDELIVAHHCVVVFGAGGAVAMTLGHGSFTGVAIHDGTVFVCDTSSQECIVCTG
jgi:DNA-binding beta-propeller fold protein YncE